MTHNRLVLVAASNPVERYSLKELLESGGYGVVEATNGGMALGHILNKPLYAAMLQRDMEPYSGMLSQAM